MRATVPDQKIWEAAEDRVAAARRAKEAEIAAEKAEIEAKRLAEARRVEKIKRDEEARKAAEEARKARIKATLIVAPVCVLVLGIGLYCSWAEGGPKIQKEAAKATATIMSANKKDIAKTKNKVGTIYLIPQKIS